MLPKNEKEALLDVEDRISMLERRLDNAKAARDAFVYHLRGKYPNWTPPLPTMSYQEGAFPAIPPTSGPNYREPLVSRLSTGGYQWDVDEQRVSRRQMGLRRTPMLNSSLVNSPIDIPTSGPLLETDIRRTRIRLREISEELRSMRIDRMNLSTEQWIQEEPFRQQRSLSLHFGPRSHPEQPQKDHLDQARMHLSRIDLTETSPVETPTEERKIDIEMSENHEKLLEEMRKSEVGVVSEAPPTFALLPQTHVRFQEPIGVQAPPSVQAPPPQAPPTEAPPTQAPPTQAPPTQAPPQNVQSLVSSLFSQMKDDSESDDSPRPVFKAPPPATSFPTKSAEKSDISQILKNLGGGGSSSEDEDFPRPSAAKPRPPPAKSLMFQDDDDSADEFFR